MTKIMRTCNRCYGRGVSVDEVGKIEVVSKYGTAHKAGTDGKTDCGIKTTDTWQWFWTEDTDGTA